MQAQPHIVTCGQDRVHLRGKAGQQPGQLGECFWRGQLVQIIDHQRDAAASIGELGQHPVGHRRCVEVGCRGWRFRAAVCTSGVTDRVEQGQPELLGVVLAALHLYEGEPARLARSAGPLAQQRCLPAAGRGRDDRHLARRRAIQSGDKITPVDQPGSCWSRRQKACLDIHARHPWRRSRSPGTFPLGISQVNALSTRANLPSCVVAVWRITGFR